MRNELRRKLYCKDTLYYKDPNEVRILVMGDIMLDRYIEGDVDRISPEAPVPVVRVKREYTELGGSGNVVRNLSELGCNVTVIGVIGNDNSGKIIREKIRLLGVRDYLLTKNDVITTEKVRIISNYRDIQMLRYDYEVDMRYFGNLEHIVPNINEIIKGYDVVVISDYAKGFINELIVDELRNSGTRVIVDPKPKNIKIYDDMWAITPNEKEYEEIVDILDRLPGSEVILRTIGSRGIDLYTESNLIGNSWIRINTLDEDRSEVYNVTGAGDTVVSIFALCTAMGIGITDSVRIANLGAGYVVTKSGTSTLPYKKFIEYLNRVTNETTNE